MITSKKIGRVCISSDLINNWPNLVQLMLSKFIPIRAEFMWHNSLVEYIGISEMFEERKDGEAVPEYVFECTTIQGGGGSIITGVNKVS